MSEIKQPEDFKSKEEAKDNLVRKGDIITIEEGLELEVKKDVTDSRILELVGIMQENANEDDIMENPFESLNSVFQLLTQFFGKAGKNKIHKFYDGDIEKVAAVLHKALGSKEKK